MKHLDVPVLLSMLLAVPVAAQAERERYNQTGYYVLTGVSEATINARINLGYRLTDIEVTSPTGPTFTAAFVSNSGVFASGFWWYHSLTSAQVSNLLTQNQARPIDIEGYDDGNGNIRFAVVMVPNTGADQKTWWWTPNTSTTNLGNLLTSRGARLTDLDEYVVGGTTYYSGVMIANVGADQRGWWWYLNVSASSIGTYLNTNQARIIDLERRSNGNYNVVMQRDTNAPTSWHWFTGLRMDEILPRLDSYGQRPIDIETYVVGGVRYYDVVGIQRVNDLTASVVDWMHQTTTGDVGVYLKQVNGPVIGASNEGRQFEPASAIKALHHVHAMRRVRQFAVTLSTPITVNTSMSGSCPTGSNPVSENLEPVLQLMMRNSDNARTQAVRAYFGQAAINNTAAALGMTNSIVQHTIGCGSEVVAAPNWTTLVDLGRLYEEVANGYLGVWRDRFYDIMLNSISGLGLDTVVDQEAASIGGLSSQAIASFKGFMRAAHKGGNYNSVNYGNGPEWLRAGFAWVSIPWVVNGDLVDREYVYGAWVNHASDLNGPAAATGEAMRKMIRPTIRAALQTWTGALAGASTFGAGCGSPTPMGLSITGLPRIGATPLYRTSNAYPSALSVFSIGFSNTRHGSYLLPLLLTPFGSAPGCRAYNSIDGTESAVANTSGVATFALGLPNNASYLGLEYFVQAWSIQQADFRTSNSVRNLVGF